MLHLLLGKDWTANRTEILSRVADDVKHRRGGRILIVPELISHEMERQLCAAAGNTASRYAEVLSFTRLARRVADQMGAAAMESLDAGGRVVAMAAAARNLTSRLKAYAAVETKPEFLTGLIDAVDEFKRCCITSEDLMAASAGTEGGFAQKLEELALLLEGYDAICSRGKRDPRDQETQLLEQLEEGGFAETHTFYIDGFPDFTRQHLAILEHLIRVSSDVTVSLNCDRMESSLLAFEKAAATAREIWKRAKNAGVDVEIRYVSSEESPLAAVREGLFQGAVLKGQAKDCLQLYRGDSAYQECLGAACEIQQKVLSGARYRDITLVCTDMAVYQSLVRLVFGRMGIPVYQSGTEEILQKSVVATVMNGLEAALSGFEQKNTLRYLRSALSPLSQDLCDEVENYAVVWAIHGKKWLEEWKNHPEGLSGIWRQETDQQLARLNEGRTAALVPLEKLRKGLADAKNLHEHVLALYGFLVDLELERRLAELAQELDAAGDNRSAQILNQLWEILLCALEQMDDVLGETAWETEHFVRLLRLLLSQYDVGTIPPVLDAVQMGPVSAMRCHKQKHLIILGAEEGNLPGYTGSAGVLTDQERVALRQMGIPLTGGSMEGIQAEFAEIYGVFCGARETISVYCSGEQPSFVYRRLCDMAGCAQELRCDMGFAGADEMEAAAYLARFSRKEQAARLGLTDAYDAIVNRRGYALGEVKPEHVKKLYGDTLNLSASQIDRQAECRLSYFLQYGLRAKERKEATVDPAEFGTYVHAVLENTARTIRDRGGFSNVSLEETMEIAHGFSETYAKEHFSQLDSDRLQYLFQRNTEELDMVVRELWLELKDALFAPKDFEVNFGGQDGLPPIPIDNGSMNAVLRGFIDRVDTWEENGNTYYRVVDYKTGRKDFDYCDVFNGVGLQMLLYMFALKHTGEDLLGDHPVACGVQYFPARAPYLSSDGRMSEEDAQKARQKEWKRKGLLLHDEAVLQAMEPGQNPTRLCYSVKKDGSISGDLADREQLKMLESYIFRYLARMVEDIASGNVTPNPYTRGTAHDACAWCPYGSICHKEDVEGRRNYKAMNAQRFWEEIGKELKTNGG